MEWVEPIRSEKKIAEIESLLKQRRPRDYLLFALGWRVALRISDLLSLTVADVLNNGEISDSIIIVEKKTRKRRIIHLSAGAKEALRWYFDRTQDTSPGTPLFPSQKGGPISRFQALRMLKKWCAMAGLDGDYGTHTLRKTWAWVAWKKGAKVSTIREALGHSREEITLRYVGITQTDVSALYDLVDS